MAKNKKADYTFQTELWYLTRVIRVRWTALPSIGEDAPPLIIQVKLGSICTNPAKGNPELCGGESVVFILVDNQGNPKGEGKRFLKHIGVTVSSIPTQEFDLTPKHTEWLLCRFGEKEQLYEYQSIVDCEPATDSQALDLTRKAIELNNSRGAIPGLRIEQDGRIVKRFSEIAKLESRIQRQIFMLLKEHYPHECSAETLLVKAWEKEGVNLTNGTS
jgi:hypothetical protein